MPTFLHGEATLHYEVEGEGFPILLFAPGGPRSSIPFWEKAPFDPRRELSASYRVIAMDQRNAGQSQGPVAASDGWAVFTADHVALLDHLGVDRCHVLGMCIGCAFALALAKAEPSRVASAVLEQPIGLANDNRGQFHAMFDGWADALAAARPEVRRDALASMRSHLYGGDFVFSVTRDDAKAMQTPMLVLRGNDVYHPTVISEELARLAPHAELVPSWKEGADLAAAVAKVKAFLAAHTPR